MTFSKIFSAAALGLLVAGSAHSALVIDTFDVGQAAVSDVSGIAAPGSTSTGGVSNYQTNMVGVDAGAASTSGLAAATDIIGLQRDIAVFKTNGAQGVDANLLGGNFNYNQGIGTSGFAIVRWDGAATDHTSAVDVDGLNAANLLNAGAQILVKSTADNANQTYDMTFQVWTKLGTDYVLSELTKTVVSNGGLLNIGFMFSEFTGANFADVGAIQMIVNTAGAGFPGMDFSIDIVGAVPEPGSLALVGLAMLGLGAARRKSAGK